MAIAKTKTALSLDRFAAIMGINPLHFNQIEISTISPSTTCDTPILQYSWGEADRIGREEIAQAIAQAESMLHEWLGFKLLPTWEYETVKFPRPNKPELFNVYGRNVRGMHQSLKTSQGYVKYGGAEAFTLIESGAAVTYVDNDSDGYAETATIIVPTTILDNEEIAIYYPGLADWEIRPIRVVLANNMATITCRREQLVISNLLEAIDANGVDGLDDDNFLATVDVYRHYNDISKMAMFLWEPIPIFCGCLLPCICNSETGDNDCSHGCNVNTQQGCLSVRDSRNGIVFGVPGEFDETNMFWNVRPFGLFRAPDRTKIWYRAGLSYKNSNLIIDPTWERVIAFYALTFLERPLCACQGLASKIQYWVNDLSESVSNQGSGTSYMLAKNILDNPLGTTRAAIYAWNLVKRNQLATAINV